VAGRHWACFWLVEWKTVRIVPLVALLLSLASIKSNEAQGPQLPCASSAACADLAVEAIQRQEYEHAHDLAWRAVQTGPRNDPALMYLLARTQSLSGRAGDAFVMLRRLAAMGFRGEDVETSDDFRRVRSLPQWPQLLEASPTTSIAPRGGAPARGATGAAVEAPRKPSAADLRIPASVVAPIALAYDAVSARFLVADADNNTLKVVDELAGNAVDLVTRNWAGPFQSTAIAIDTRRGDLWAAAVDAGANGRPQSRLYKMQLVSGRLLNTVNLPKSAGPTRITDLAIAANTLFLLDDLGGRIFRLGTESTTPRLHMKLVGVSSVHSLAVAGNDVLYIAHAKGILRADLNTRTTLPLIAVNADVAGFQSIAWHDGALYGIQAADGRQVAVRIELDHTGKIATAREVLGPATTRAAVMAGGVFYYLSTDGTDGGVIVRKAAAKK
jgi:hypothetical protein